MESRKVIMKIGIIGCGRATETLHLPALSRIEQVEVVALADPAHDRLQSVADRFNVAGRYSSHDELLQKADVDVVAVCVPVQFHVAVALDALDAGKHVFIEKPLALTLEDADRLIERASGSDRKIMVGFNLRQHRLIQQARNLIQEGSLGALEGIRSIWTSAIRYRQELPAWRNSRELGGGALFEISVHHFDLWRFLLDSEIVDVYASSTPSKGPEETVTVAAKMSNGTVASALFSEHTSDNNALEIFGRGGRLAISLYRFDGLEQFPMLSTPGGLGARIGELMNLAKTLPQGIAIARQGGDFKMSYHSEWLHFVDAISNDSPVVCSLEDGKRALEAVLAAGLSIECGVPIKLASLRSTEALETSVDV